MNPNKLRVTITLAIIMNFNPATTMPNKTPVEMNTLRNVGIFFEHIGEIATYRNKYTIITSFKPPAFDKIAISLERSRLQLKTICERLKKRETNHTCDVMLEELRTELEDIQFDEQTIHHHTKRSKRSMFDFVGSASKFLFGTMDNDDSKNIHQELANIHENENNIFKNVKEQVVIVKSNFDVLSGSVQKLNEQSQDMQNELKQLTNWQTTTMEDIRNKTAFMILNEKFMEITSLIMIKSIAMSRHQDQTLSIISSIQSGKLHPLLMTYKRVIEEVRNLGDEEIDKSILNEQHINQLAQIDYMEIEGRIIIKIDIPAPPKERFELHKIYLIPIKINNTLLSYTIKDEFLATNKDKSKFTTVQHDEYNRCSRIIIKFEKTLLLCESKSPIITNKRDDCLLNLFDNPFQIKPNCEFARNPAKNTLTKLITGNSWLFSTINSIRMMVKCKNNEQTIILNNTGIITFKENCEIIAEDFILPVTGSKIHNLTISQPWETNIPTDININIPIDEQKEIITPTSKILKTYHYNNYNKELREEQMKINHLMLNTKKTEEKLDRQLKFETPTIPVIGYIIAACITTIGITIVTMKCSRKRTTINETIQIEPKRITNHPNIKENDIEMGTNIRGIRIL